MKKNFKKTVILLGIIPIISSCKTSNINQTTNKPSTSITSSITSNTTKLNQNKFPSELKEIPNNYYNPIEQKGTLVDFYYNTYESFSYESKTQPLRKHALIYLPYSYDSTKKYNILYLMHGGWSNENYALGTPSSPSRFKNVIDNAIANADFESLIIVCPTYNNTSSSDSGSFSLALQLTRNYHDELINDLMPSVESSYSTYAGDGDDTSLKASRNHRAFGGFSMGSVATWRTFQYALDYFSYFIPMSCGTSLDDEEIWKSAENRNKNDYFVMMMVGTSDFSYSYDTSRSQNMKNSKYFEEQTESADGNFIFRTKKDYSHDGYAHDEYTYNALSYMWKTTSNVNQYNEDTKIDEVINDPVFGNFGRLIFPVNKNYYSGETLKDLHLTWYNNINVAHTVEITNYLRNKTIAGIQVFFDIYSAEEKKADPSKENTGLFFFKGNKNTKFALTCAGGGFSYVGAIHDSFPHALELSKKGYNAFAIIYRPNASKAYEDLARAITFIFNNAKSLEINTEGYSLWGGSAGGRMAATISSYGVESYGGKNGIPKPSVAVIQYTGHSDYNKNGEPATFVTVGENDGIANYQAMKRRIDALNTIGTKTEFHSYPGLGHGFGLGVNTIAEGWINKAISFWENNS